LEGIPSRFQSGKVRKGKKVLTAYAPGEEPKGDLAIQEFTDAGDGGGSEYSVENSNYRGKKGKRIQKKQDALPSAEKGGKESPTTRDSLKKSRK